MSPMSNLNVVLVTLFLPVMFSAEIQVVDSNVTEQIDTQSGDDIVDDGGVGGFDDYSMLNLEPRLNDSQAEDQLQIKLDRARSIYGLGNIGEKLELSDEKKQSLFEEIQSERISLKADFREKFKLDGAENLNILFDENRESEIGCSEEEAVSDFLNRTIAFLIYGNVTQDETRNQYAFMLESNNDVILSEDEAIKFSYAIKSNGVDEGSFCQSVLFFRYELPAVTATIPTETAGTAENTTAMQNEPATTSKSVHAADLFSSAVSSTLSKTMIFLAFSLIFISM